MTSPAPNPPKHGISVSKKPFRVLLVAITAVVPLLLGASASGRRASDTTVRPGEHVTLIRAKADGVTYTVQTPTGRELWRDRDLHHFAAAHERCRVLKSLGTEVQLYVPIMNAKYWFTVLRAPGSRQQ